MDDFDWDGNNRPPEPDREWGDAQLSDIKEVSEFLRSFGRDGEGLALLVIDVQQMFCERWLRGNTETEEVSCLIADKVTQLRSAGVPVYNIYYDHSLRRGPEEAGFYKYSPAPEDSSFAKDGNSAFGSGRLKEMLRACGHKNLLVCGFNLSACIRETIMDARKEGFNVTLLRDLTGNGASVGPFGYMAQTKREKEKDLEEFRANGIHITDSGVVISMLQAVNGNKSAGPDNGNRPVSGQEGPGPA